MAKSFEDYNSELQSLSRTLDTLRARQGRINRVVDFNNDYYILEDQIKNTVDRLTNLAIERNTRFPDYARGNTSTVSGSTTQPTDQPRTFGGKSRRPKGVIPKVGDMRGTTGETGGFYPGSAGPGDAPFTGDVDSNVGSVMEFDDARVGARTILDRFGGLGSLTDMVTQFIMNKGGTYTQEDVMSYIRSSDAYKKRFAGNEARAKANLPTLDEGDYLRLEDSYRAAMRGYLPEGFYDSPEDFVKFMANDVSAEEIATRAKTAYALSQNANKEARKALKDFYGVGDKEIAAYFLDPTKATPLLTERANAAVVGGEALRADLQVSRTYAETLAQEGLSGEARGAFEETATSLGTTRLLGDVGGQRISTENVADAALRRNVKATRKVEGLRSQQRARFSGSSSGTNILGTDLPGTF